MDLPVVDPWFAAEDAGEGVTRLWEPHIDPLIESNIWHVPGSAADLVVDMGNGVGALRPAIEALAVDRTVIAFATHGHFDHVGGLHEFEDRRIHRDDLEMVRSPFPLKLTREDFTAGTEEMFVYYGYPLPDLLITAVPWRGFDVKGWVSPGAEPTMLLDDGDVVDLGNRVFTVLHTPGHTAGSACLFEERTGTLFSGDAIYVDGRLSWDDPAAASASLLKLAALDARIVHTGHGRSFDGSELRRAVDGAIRDIEAGTT